MERVPLGSTGLSVSRLSIGTEHFGKVHGIDLSPERGAAILKRSVELGINLWDTSDDYATHAHVAAGLRLVNRSDVLVVTKTYAKGADAARETLEKYLEELGTDYIDVLLCHCVPPNEVPLYQGTLEFLHSARKDGRVRAVGMSSHHAQTIRIAAGMPEIQVVMAPVNRIGRSNEDCTPDEMKEALRAAYEAGKGVLIIKTLAYGKLVADLAGVLAEARDLPFVHSVCVGVKSEAEMEEDVDLFERASSMAPAG